MSSEEYNMWPPKGALRGMSPQEMAVDWVRQVYALPADEIDLSSDVLSPEGQDAVVQVEMEYQEQPHTGDPQEEERQAQERATKLQEIAKRDPGVAEKNRFLALLLEQCDPKTQAPSSIAELRGMLLGEGEHSAAAEEELDVEKKRVLERVANIVGGAKAAQSYMLLAPLRMFAERTGNDPFVYKMQFFGLWAIYKAGQDSTQE